MQENPNVYFSELLPEIFYEYLSELSDEELEKIKYDLIIMDEGQDILKPLYLYSLDTLLRGGFANGDWAVFYDESRIYTIRIIMTEWKYCMATTVLNLNCLLIAGIRYR